MQKAQTLLPVGTIIRRRYLVEDHISKSSNGAVYLVRDQRDKQGLFALKEVFLPGKKEQHRFTLERVSLKQVDHPALPHIYDVFNDGIQGRAYIVMNYIEGPNLEVLQQQQLKKRFSLPQVMTIMAPVMDALTYLHSRHPPIIHGDIKPANIIVPKEDDEAMLVDLDIPKEYDTNTTTAVVRHSTPYRAPEQYSGETSPRTDIYALGATLYTLLTGTVPPDALYRLVQLNERKPDPLVPVNLIAPGVPIAIAKIVHRAMSISGHSRFSTVEQFWQTLNVYSKARQSLYVPDKDYKALNTYPVQQQSEATIIPSVPPQPPVVPKHGLTKSDSVSVAKQPGAPHTRKPGVLLLPVLLVLFISLSLGVGLLTYEVKNHTSVPNTATTAQYKVTSPSNPGPTVAPTPTFSVNIAGSYKGTIYNILLGLKTNISLTRIQQSQRNIRGYFSGFQANGLQVDEPFNGMIDVHGHLHFTVAEYAGQVILAFDGSVQSGGTLVGNYCSLDQHGQCAGEYGLWSVAPG